MALPESAAAQKKKMEEGVRIATVVAFYFVISISVVFLNKAILSGLRFPFPLFVTWFQLVVALVFIVLWGECGKAVPAIGLMPPFDFKWDIAVKVSPLTGHYIAMIVFNNLCLKYVEVSFYQVARSLTIVFNIIFTYFLLGQVTSRRSLQACGVVFLGYVLGSVGEVRFTWEGLIYGLLSSVFVSTYSIYVKKKLALFDGNQWQLLAYNTSISVLLLFPFVLLSGEVQGIMALDPADRHPYFWSVMVLTALMGFLINIAMFLQIKFTSPLTNNISGTAKACVQTVLGVMIWGNPISYLVRLLRCCRCRPRFSLSHSASFCAEWVWHRAVHIWQRVLLVCAVQRNAGTELEVGAGVR